MKYGLDDKPGGGPLLLYGLQWWVVSLPTVIIMGLVVARIHHADIAQQMFSMQKLFVLMGAVTVVQVLWGHRLPLVAGPASTLLVGLLASVGAGAAAVYTAILAGGALLAAAAFSGLLSRMRFLFTPRIVAVILVLIAFTLTPTILRLVLEGTDQTAFHLVFALLTVAALVLCNVWLPGIWKSLTVILGLMVGSLCYFLYAGFPVWPELKAGGAARSLFLPGLEFHTGTIVSFLFCFFALTINELGSIESIRHMLRAEAEKGRIKRGAGLTGLANVAAGALGVIGPVDFSFSAGVIAATGCASRYTLIPSGLGLVLCGLLPGVAPALTAVPNVVMGALMLYLMASQLSSGLGMLASERGISDFNSGLTVGLPLMVGLLIAFVPAAAFNGFPELLRPIIGNGFVMGTITVVIMEHGVFRKKSKTGPTAG